MTRPVVLAFVGFYLPGFKAGGPVRSIANMVEQLADTFEFRVVAADRDLGDASPYGSVAINQWTGVGKARVFYRAPGEAGWKALLRSPVARSADLIYLNSLFSPGAALRPLVERRLGRLGSAPILLAPRGELSAGALGLKALKKRAFLTASRLVGLHRDVSFHASSAYEAQDIQKVFGPVPIHIALNLAARSGRHAPHHAPDESGGSLRVVFLSRITEKKNLLGALDILARVSGPVEFDIYGVVEDSAYWAACQSAITALPGHVTVRYLGPVRPDQVDATLATYDLFLLPTLGENYGHVIRESLAAGVPVLISDQTPWRDLQTKGVGADLPLEQPDSFVAWIDRFRTLNLDVRARIRDAARATGDDPVVAEQSREATVRMLRAALQHRR